MKTKILAILMAAIISASLFAMPASAAEDAHEEHTHIEIIFEDENVSPELKEKATAFYLNGGEETDGAATYGLTCTLFGHKLESSTTSTITHKARTTVPRCLKKTYDYEACTRCDYENSTLRSSSYIYCCA